MNFPAAFAPYRQFVLYKAIPQADGSIKKLPISPVTFEPFAAGANWQADPTQWVDGHTAYRLSQLSGLGVGFLFTEKDPFFFVDIDHCLVDGQWTPRAHELLAWFQGCAVEVSVSGTGLHIFGTGAWPSTETRRCKSIDETFDVYTSGRFVALTGTHMSGDAAVEPSPAVINQICVTYLPRVAASGDSLGWTWEPVPEYSPLTDDELLSKAMKSSNVSSIFGDRASFADLWTRNERTLARAYPPDRNDTSAYDESKADAALAQHLAFWTGRNCDRVLQLMKQSALSREKWAREDYLLRTIERAVTLQRDVYQAPSERRRKQLEENVKIGESPEEIPLPNIMSLETMLDQLVYVGEQHAVGHKGTSRVRKKTAAADEYAASRHTYVDPETRQEKSTDAFKVWLKSDRRLTVDTVTWRPGAEAICTPAEGHGVAFNTWRGLPVLPVPSDWRERVQPWVDHINWLCVEPAIAQDFMRWLAHIVQRPAQLPHTCYLHVTPVTGIGRNWMAGVLCRALRGYVAAGVDLGGILDGKFNGRLSQKLVAIVDEVREGGDRGAQRIRAERLKSLVTEEVRGINPKFGVEVQEVNCCRWLMFSQHLDALPFENNDRRVIVVSNPIERRSPEYYESLYALLSDTAFIGSVRQYLATYDIAGFNPSAPAPMTEAKKAALEVMTGEVDYAIAEFVERWPAPIAAREQIREYVGLNVTEGHLHYALLRAGLITLPKRIKLANGVRSRVVVLRGSRADAEQLDARYVVDTAEVKFKLESNA